jgi:tRNA pseudouridine38-40 synthase
MVRSMVALLMEAGRGGLAADEVAKLLSAGTRALHGRAAPPRGLTLERVIYESKSGALSGAEAGSRTREQGS